MNYPILRIWIVVTFTLAVIAIVMLAIWQIAVIPTPGTMRIFIPLIIGLLSANALLGYITINFSLKKLTSLPVIIGITAVITAGLIAGVSHFVHFIISPEADPALSKVIGVFVLSSSLSAYFLTLWLIWSFRKNRGR